MPFFHVINVLDLDKIPLKCQRPLMPLRNFNVEAKFVPSKNMVDPDTPSRSPLPSNQVCETLEMEVSAYADFVYESRPVSDTKMNRIKQYTKTDSEIQRVITFT